MGAAPGVSANRAVTAAPGVRATRAVAAALSVYATSYRSARCASRSDSLSI
jgi:hypothetical protein